MIGPKKGTVNNPRGVNQYTGAQGAASMRKVGGAFGGIEAMQKDIRAQQAAIVKGANSVKMVIGDTAKAVGGIAKNLVMAPVDKAVSNMKGNTGKVPAGSDIPKYTKGSLKMRSAEASNERKKAIQLAEITNMARKGQGKASDIYGNVATAVKNVRASNMTVIKNKTSNELSKGIGMASRGARHTMDRAVIEGNYAKKMAPIIGGEVVLSTQAGYNKVKSAAKVATAEAPKVYSNAKATVMTAADRIKKRMW